MRVKHFSTIYSVARAEKNDSEIRLYVPEFEEFPSYTIVLMIEKGDEQDKIFNHLMTHGFLDLTELWQHIKVE